MSYPLGFYNPVEVRRTMGCKCYSLTTWFSRISREPQWVDEGFKRSLMLCTDIRFVHTGIPFAVRQIEMDMHFREMNCTLPSQTTALIFWGFLKGLPLH